MKQQRIIHLTSCGDTPTPYEVKLCAENTNPHFEKIVDRAFSLDYVSSAMSPFIQSLKGEHIHNFVELYFRNIVKNAPGMKICLRHM